MKKALLFRNLPLYEIKVVLLQPILSEHESLESNE